MKMFSKAILRNHSQKTSDTGFDTEADMDFDDDFSFDDDADALG